MKYLFLSLIIIVSLPVLGQVKVSQGDNSPNFQLSKQPDYSSFSTASADYFVICRTERFEKINTLIIADKNGNISTAKDVRLNMGVFNDNYAVNNLLVVGASPMLFVQHRNKADGKNTFSARNIDKDGNVQPTELPIGSMDFVKMSNAGLWYSALTPDKKHVAVIGEAPYEKGTANQFVFFIMDEKMQVVSKGQFSFAGNLKNIPVFDFLASDKGDLYIVSEEFDKSYKYPILYKYTAAGEATIIPVMIADAGLKNMNYISRVNPAGELVIAGYMQKKSTFSAGDTQAIGSWLFNSSKINEVKTFNFDKPVTNLTARNLVYNGDTFFLIGEQYKADKQDRNMSGMSALSMDDDVYNYLHGDIMVTGFTPDATKKFEMSLNRNWTAKDFDQELMVASGTINNKLALVYNDQYGKYFDDNSYHKNYKLPVAVLITNDGLMENPVPFAKELDVLVSTYKLYPQFFNANQGHIMILSGNAASVKTITFQ